MHRVVIQPEAEADLRATHDWYETRSVGLGGEFLGEVDRLLQRIAEFPLLSSIVHRDVRRASLQRFPYVSVFVVRSDTIFVLGVFHHRRDPELMVARIAGQRDDRG